MKCLFDKYIEGNWNCMNKKTMAFTTGLMNQYFRKNIDVSYLFSKSLMQNLIYIFKEKNKVTISDVNISNINKRSFCLLSWF